MLLLFTALLLGVLHGLGADHLMAIAALSVDGRQQPSAVRRARALGVAVRFAVGHAILLGFGAGALVIIGWSIPLVVERGGEMLGGILLIGMGAAGIWGLFAGRVYGHSHVHDQEPQPHWHLHIGARDRHPRDRSHSHLPTIIGAAFAISSLRALALLTPFGAGLTAAPLPMLLGLIGAFAAGILLSMALFGVALATVMSTRAMAQVGRAAAAGMGIASLALGVFWVIRA